MDRIVPPAPDPERVAERIALALEEHSMLCLDVTGTDLRALILHNLREPAPHLEELRVSEP